MQNNGNFDDSKDRWKSNDLVNDWDCLVLCHNCTLIL
jgi:hypothetical protein